MIKQFENKQPQLGRNVYISENAAVIGEVMLGDFDIGILILGF